VKEFENSQHDAGTGATTPVRRFAGFHLTRLVGKSERSMTWQALDPQSGNEVLLTMPRVQPDAAAREAWLQRVRKAARLSHPHIAPPIMVGEFEHWPFACYERRERATFIERIARRDFDGLQLARWVVQAAQALAFAHEANIAHRDLQGHCLLVGDDDRVQLLGLEVASRAGLDAASTPLGDIQDTRAAAPVDVLALALLAWQAIAGAPPLDEPDVLQVIRRLPPAGNDMLRLPYALSRPVAEPLRAILNRATDRQERRRYQTARTFERALEGWIRAAEGQGDGPLALVLDRIRIAGVLPSQPGAAERAAHLALMERNRTAELAEVILGDIGLTFELLRSVNRAAAQSERIGTGEPVLMVRRAVAMVGLDGVRRAALALRPWPGPMNEAAAGELTAAIRQAKLAGRLARRLAPPGYDGEVVTLITLLQNLGRLVVQYHFPEEARQIRKLMQPVDMPGGKPLPGMAAESASFAVLGIDIESIGAAVAVNWGLEGEVLRTIQRIPAEATVRRVSSDWDALRLAGSCANDVVDALTLPDALRADAVKRIAQRYLRPLGLEGREFQQAIQEEMSGGAARRPRPRPAAGNPASAVPAGATGRPIPANDGTAAPLRSGGAARPTRAPTGPENDDPRMTTSRPPPDRLGDVPTLTGAIR